MIYLVRLWIGKWNGIENVRGFNINIKDLEEESLYF